MPAAIFRTDGDHDRGRTGCGAVSRRRSGRQWPTVTISALLAQVPRGRALARASVEGPSDSLTSLVDHLAARLLALAAGEPDQRLAGLTATTPAAFRAYMDGRVLLRRNEFFRSQKKFEEALGADSTFALAGLGFVRANLEGVNDNRDREPRRLGGCATVSHRRTVPSSMRCSDRSIPRPTPPPRPRSGRRTALTQLAPDDPEAWDLDRSRSAPLRHAYRNAGCPRAIASRPSEGPWRLDSGSTIAATRLAGIAGRIGGYRRHAPRAAARDEDRLDPRNRAFRFSGRSPPSKATR